MISFAGIATLSHHLALAAAAANLVQNAAAQIPNLSNEQKLSAAVAGLKVLNPAAGAAVENVTVSAEVLVNASVAIYKELQLGLFKKSSGVNTGNKA